MGILTKFNGVSVHDFWKLYENFKCSHAYCNAHIIRELTFVVERKSQQWAGDLIDLLLEIKKKVDISDNKNLTSHEIEYYKKEYSKLVQTGYNENPLPERKWTRGRRRKGKIRCLVERLDNYQEDILRFMIDHNTPFDNNLGERDLRMVKVREKISGTFKNNNRANDYCKIRSYISTIKKQKKDVFCL